MLVDVVVVDVDVVDEEVEVDVGLCWLWKKTPPRAADTVSVTVTTSYTIATLRFWSGVDTARAAVAATRSTEYFILT